MSQDGEVARERSAHPYNPSLDGIRALAVCAVLLYHGGATTGGFFGVDVFFVLSGFLICGLLLAELDSTGSLRLGRFWSRRARRLIPALAVVALFVVLLLPLLADDLPSTLRADVLTSVTYSSNWWYVFNGQAYANGTPTPVLHTWSLAIEEQWYLVFPLLLLGLALVFRRRLGVWLGPVLLAAAAASAAWTAWLAQAGASSERLYFGTDTRVQGLLVGAALAAFLALPGENAQADAPGRWRGLMGWGALVALAAMTVTASLSAPWLPRGGFFVVAVLSGALILSVAPTPATWSPAPVLSSRPLVAIGLVSYGLYLWHFPVYLWLTPDRVGVAGWPLLLLRLGVTAALAVTSYYVVEQPIRRGTGWAGSPLSWTRVGVAAVVVVVALTIGIARLPATSAPDSLVALRDLASSPPTPPAPAAGTVLIVGDSLALSVLPAARAAGERTVNIATRFGCGTVPFTAVAEGVVLRPEEPLCSDWERARAREIAAQSADVGILYLGPWEQYDRWIDGRAAPAGSPAWVEATTDAYRRVLEEMIPHVSSLVVVLNHCHGAPDTGLPVETMYRAGRYAPVVNDPDRISATNSAVERAVAEVGASATLLDPGTLLCANGHRDDMNGVPLTSDGVHFTEEGGAMLWKWLVEELAWDERNLDAIDETALP